MLNANEGRMIQTSIRSSWCNRWLSREGLLPSGPPAITSRIPIIPKVIDE